MSELLVAGSQRQVTRGRDSIPSLRAKRSSPGWTLQRPSAARLPGIASAFSLATTEKAGYLSPITRCEHDVLEEGA
jgi:hypothetical protein